MNDFELIQRYLLNQADEDDLRRIDEKLSSDDAFVEAFAKYTVQDAALREIAHLDSQQIVDSEFEASTQQRTVEGRLRAWIPWIAVAIAASVGFVAMGTLWLQRDDQPIAVIVASENAAWVSELPTSNGSALSPGELTLVSGIATLRFNSGATMILESPARLTLLSDMNAHLDSGAAIVDVPESAIGFTVTTPSGDAIDLGTRFAVSIDTHSGSSEFEVLEGSLSVGAANLADRVTLVGREVATVKLDSITSRSEENVEDEEVEDEEAAPVTRHTIRLKPYGRASTFIRRNKEPQRHRKSILLVKSSLSGVNYDRRLVVSFDTSGIEMDNVRAVRFRLNQVNSELGLACRLPEMSVFSVYGLVNESKSKWEPSWTWEQAPQPDDGVLLGTFEIPRSRSSGECILESEELSQFVRDHQHRPLTLIVVRSTTQVGRGGQVLAHAFASDDHPSLVGPRLELESAQTN